MQDECPKACAVKFEEIEALPSTKGAHKLMLLLQWIFMNVANISILVLCVAYSIHPK